MTAVFKPTPCGRLARARTALARTLRELEASARDAAATGDLSESADFESLATTIRIRASARLNREN